MSKLVLFFLNNPFYPVHLQKDVGLFPLYLQKSYFDSAQILKIGDEKQEDYFFQGINVSNLFTYPKLYQPDCKISLFYEYKCIFKSLWYICTHRDVTHIMMFHINRFSLYFSFLLKFFFPKIKTYVKCDTSAKSTTQYPHFKNPSTIKQYIKKKMYDSIDLFTIETFSAYQALYDNPFFHNRNLHLIPNGLDNNWRSLSLKNKTKTIITVGRLGTYQKNTELFLDAITKLNIKDWIIKLIGPIETIEYDFQKYIDTFFAEHPHLKQNVIFSGAITDPTTLQKEYESASIFVSTSRYESFGIALLEAAGAGCYIIATNVGAAYDITNNGTLGYLCNHSEAYNQNEQLIQEQITKQVQQIIDGNINLHMIQKKQSDFINKHFMIQDIVKHSCFKEWANS